MKTNSDMLDDFYGNYWFQDIINFRKATIAHLKEKSAEVDKMGERIRAAEDQTAKLRKELKVLVSQKIDDLEKLHYFDKRLKYWNIELDENGDWKQPGA